MDIREQKKTFDIVAEKTLIAYGLGETHVAKLLQISENITYMVRNRITDEKEYVLRVGRPGYHSVEELKSELLWIQQIQDYTPITVASPIQTPGGTYVVETTIDNEIYTGVLFEFLSGEAPDETDEKNVFKEFEMLGETTAYLHKQSKMWNKANTMQRFVWDYDTMIGRNARWGRWQDAEGLTMDSEKTLLRASKIIKKRMDNYGKGQERFGLIHADLRLANLLVDGSEIKVIDFDDCGFSWYLHDMASAVSFIEDKPIVPSLIDAWKAGYTKVECLTCADDTETDTFIMQRRLQLLAWLTSHKESDPVKELSIGYLDGTVDLAERYLSKFS